ncbi:MAG: hypothetical protein ACK5TO_15300 [Planctomycetaceae bacterium]
MSNSSLPPLPPADGHPPQELDNSRFRWPGGLLPLPPQQDQPGPIPLPLEASSPLKMTMEEVNFPFVDQQAVEQLEYLDKISIRWNRGLLATLLFLPIVLILGGFFLRKHFLESWAATWKREAQELAAQEDWEAAAAKAQLALRLDPEDRSNRLVAGRAMVRPTAPRPEYEEGRDLLEEHLIEVSQDREIRLLMVRSAMQRGDHEWVLTSGLAPLRNSIPNDPEFRALALECHRFAGAWVDAARILVAAINNTPQDPQLYRQLLEWIDASPEPVSTLRNFNEELDRWQQAVADNEEPLAELRTSDAAQAEERTRQRMQRELAQRVLRRMRTRAQPGWWFAVAMSEHALRQGDDAVAETFWRKAREAAPNQPEVNVLGVEVLEARWQTLAAAGDDQRGDLAANQARELLVQAVQGRTSTPGLFDSLGRVQLLRGEYPAARQTYRSGLDALPRKFSGLGEPERQVWSVLFHLGLAEALARGVEDASAGELQEFEQEWGQLTRDLAELAPRSEVIEFVESLREFGRGQLSVAVRRLEELRGRLPFHPEQPLDVLVDRIDSWLVECHRQLGRPEQLEAVLRRAIATRPDWQQGRQELCRLLVRRGLPWQSLGEDGAESDLPGGLVQLECRFAEQLLRPRAERVWSQVDAQLRTLEPEYPNNPRFTLLRAERLLEEGQVVAAVDLLSSQLKEAPASSELAIGLVRLLRWQAARNRVDNSAWMSQVTDSFRRAQGDRVVYRLLLAETRGLGSPDTDYDAEQIQQLWEGSTNWPVRQKRGLARGLLKLARQSGRDSREIEIGRFALGVGLQDLDMLAQVAAAADRGGETDLAEQALGAILRREGEAGPWGSLLTAYRTLRELTSLDSTGSDVRSSRHRDKLSAVLRDLGQACTQCPRWGSAHRLRGIAWELWGDPGEAGKAFQLAIRHGNRGLEALRWFSDELFRMRRDRELVELHDTWSAVSLPVVLPIELSQPSAIDLPLRGATWHELAERLTRIQLAVARDTPLDETLAELDTLTGTSPYSPGAWQLRLSLALQQGGDVAGRAVLKQLVAAVPSTPSHRKPLSEALGWDVLGEAALAEERFREAVGSESDGWESTREWIAWLVRQGKLERAATELTQAPAKLDSALSEDFQTWSQKVRHALVAADSDTLPEFRRHLAELSPQGDGIENSFWQDTWYACLCRGRSASEDQRLLRWLEGRSRSTGLNPDQRLARLRARIRLGDPQVWNDWKRESLGQPLDLETALLIVAADQRGPQLQENPGLDSLLEEAFDVLRRNEPRSLTTRSVDAFRLVRQGFSQEGMDVYTNYRRRIPDRSPAELLVDLARSGRLTRLRSRLELAGPSPRPAESPWSALDDFPSQREILLRHGAVPGLEPLWKESPALDCLRDEALLLVGLGLDSIAEVEAAQQVLEDYSSRGRLPTDRFQPALLLARRGNLNEAQRMINQFVSSRRDSDLELTLGFVSIFESAPVPDNTWAVPLRRLQQVGRSGLGRQEQRRVLHALARLKTLTADEAEAMGDYLTLLRDQPDDLIAGNNLAWVRAVTGQDLSEARGEMDRLISLYGELPDLLDTRATVCLQQGDLSQAHADWKLLCDLAPLGRFLAQLSICQSRMGEQAAAQQSFLRSVAKGFQPNGWLPPVRDLWEGEFNALLQDASARTKVNVTPQDTDGRNRTSTTEKTP